MFWDHPSCEQSSKGRIKICRVCTDDNVFLILLDNRFLSLLQNLPKAFAHSQNKWVLFRCSSPHTADIDCDLIPQALLCIRSKERISVPFPVSEMHLDSSGYLVNTRDGRRLIYIEHSEQSCHLPDASRKSNKYSAAKRPLHSPSLNLVSTDSASLEEKRPKNLQP